MGFKVYNNDSKLSCHDTSLADVEVCDAADYAEDQVFLDFGYADDVGDNTFFGDSNVCLNS